MKRIYSFIILSLLATIPLFGAAKGPLKLKHAKPESVGMDSRMLALCDSVIESAISLGDTPGAVVCIARNDRIVFEKAYGNRAVLPETEPMSVETIFDLASLSKCLGTTLSFMQLVEQKKVSLDDPVDKYLPEFEPWRDTTGAVERITVRQLMTHTSGLAPYVDMAGYDELYPVSTPDTLKKHICTLFTRRCPPGTRMIYSCPNFITLQYILESVTGQKLCDYAQEHVFDMLHLENTFYLPTDREVPEELLARIAPTELVDSVVLRGQVHDPTARLLNWGNSGNAGVFSTAGDIAVICSMILNRGNFKGHRILSPKSVRTMCAVQDPEFGRGLGWDVSSAYAGVKGDYRYDGNIICHTGYTGTSVVIDLDEHLAIIVLTNAAHPYDKGHMGKHRAAITNIVKASVK